MGWSRRAIEEWRSDPARHEAWLEELRRRRDGVLEAQRLLRLAVAAMPVTGTHEECQSDVLYLRCQRTVRAAVQRLDSDARFLTEEPSAAYLGNLSAFGLPGEPGYGELVADDGRW